MTAPAVPWAARTAASEVALAAGVSVHDAVTSRRVGPEVDDEARSVRGRAGLRVETRRRIEDGDAGRVCHRVLKDVARVERHRLDVVGPFRREADVDLWTAVDAVVRVRPGQSRRRDDLDRAPRHSAEERRRDPARGKRVAELRSVLGETVHRIGERIRDHVPRQNRERADLVRSARRGGGPGRGHRDVRRPRPVDRDVENDPVDRRAGLKDDRLEIGIERLEIPGAVGLSRRPHALVSVRPVRPE